LQRVFPRDFPRQSQQNLQACRRPPAWMGLPAIHTGSEAAGDPGTVLVNDWSLYWGCRFAGYGNKRPSQ